MPPLGWMLLYAILLWWLSTGIILFLNHLNPATFRTSLAAASVILVASLAGIAVTVRTPTVAGAYLGFTFALLAWGWQEMSFFMGLITGPRRTADPTATGLRRMWHATQTLLYHEAAIALVGIVILLVSVGHPNHVAAWTYLALWGMRISAKLNVHFGVRNLNEQWVPQRLAYLRTYMTRRRMNPLLPISVMLGATLAAACIARALTPGTDAFQTAAHGFIGTILALGVVEHIAMVLPLPFAALWTNFAAACPVGQELAAQAPPATARLCPHARISPVMERS